MPPSQPGNRDLIRAINRSLILNTIKSHGPIGRADVARSTGLSAATVTGITAELIEDGLVFEKETGNSSGGRRPILLALNPAGGFVVGIKLTEVSLIGALTDLEAAVVTNRTTPLRGRSPESVVASLAEAVVGLLQRVKPGHRSAGRGGR